MPGKVKNNHLNIKGAKKTAVGGVDILLLVKFGWKTGLMVIVGTVIIAGGLFLRLPGASASEDNGQNQDQTQENNQTVNVDINQTISSSTSNEATQEATNSASINKTPETGVSLLSMTAMSSFLPIGLFLAKYGEQGKSLVEQIKLDTLGNTLVRNRYKGTEKA